MAVLNAQYKHPNSAYSQGLKDLIDSMLKINPTERPDIHMVNLNLRSSAWSNGDFFLGHSRDRSCVTDTSIGRRAALWGIIL